MTWPSFKKNGDEYNLNHLNPFNSKLVKPAKHGQMEQAYPCRITFSCHCFTRTPENGEVVEQSNIYRDPKNENRIFCAKRYELSKGLKSIIVKRLTKGGTKCFHTERGNYFIVELAQSGGKKVSYEIYFVLGKSSSTQKENAIYIHITSAHPRPLNSHRKYPKVRMQVLAHNAIVGKPTKMAQETSSIRTKKS